MTEYLKEMARMQSRVVDDPGDPAPKPEPVTASPWAPGTRERHGHIVESMPAVLVTHFADWQERVDNPIHDAKIGPFITYLFPVRAIEYHTVEEHGRKISVPVPDVPERTYLVTAPSAHEATDAVTAYLKRQVPWKWFATSVTSGITILQPEPK